MRILDRKIILTILSVLIIFNSAVLYALPVINDILLKIDELQEMGSDITAKTKIRDEYRKSYLPSIRTSPESVKTSLTYNHAIDPGFPIIVT